MLPENAVSKAFHDPKAVVSFLNTRARSVSSRAASRIEGVLTRPISYHLFDDEWDVAVILDALRFDAASASRLETLLGHPRRVYSCAGHSETWIERTFERATKAQRQATAYVTANAHTELVLPKDVGYVDRVYEDGFDEELGTFPPRVVTNRAIEASREQPFDRLLIHYMQPHLPPAEHSSVDFNLESGGDGWVGGNPWKRVENGELGGDEVIDAYMRNVDLLFDELDLLLRNVEAERVIVTADHGNHFGEFGQWGHYRKWNFLPWVRYVPLFETSATDTGVHEPEWLRIESDADLQERLEALGYK